jgi:hypothetical protein
LIVGNQSKVLRVVEGQRFKKHSSGAFMPAKDGDYVATWKLSGNLEYVPVEGLALLQEHTAELEAAKQEYLTKLTNIKAGFDAKMAELNKKVGGK